MTWLERHRADARRSMWVYSMAAGVLVFFALIVLAVQNVASQLLHGLIA